MNKTGKELDEYLNQLATKAKEQPRLTPQRQLVMGKLLQGILKSGRLYRPQGRKLSGINEDIYEEACQNLLLYLCQNIDKYDPGKNSVIAWVNFLLEQRFLKEAIIKTLEKQDIQRIIISELEHLAVSAQSLSLTEIVKECIKQDPEDVFKTEHIQNHSGANFQNLFERRISGESWAEISRDLGIKEKTLTSFYCRCFRKFSGKIKFYCQL